MSESNTVHLEFEIRILIRHPTIDPLEITNELSVDPDHFWKVGEQRKTPRGRALGRLNKFSMWSKSFVFKNERNFFHRMSNTIELFEDNKEFVEKLINSGGTIHLNAELSGRRNIGDVLSWENLRRLADLKIDLGVEVFPDV